MIENIQTQQGDSNYCSQITFSSRYLTDCQTREGIDQILSAYPFENDKNRARCVLNTVRSDVWDKMASGGHQGYAALGGLFTQSRPLEQHLYGPVDKQLLIQQVGKSFCHCLCTIYGVQT